MVEGPRSAGGMLFGSRPRGAERSFVEENISEVGLLNKQSKPLSGLFELLNITDFHSELPKDVASRHKNPYKEGTNIESSLLNTKKNSIITYQYIISKNFFNFVSNLYIYNLTNSEKLLNSLCGYSVLPSFEEFSKGVNKPRLRKYSNTERIAASQHLYGSPWDGILIFNFLYRSALFNGRQSEVHLGWLLESRKYSTKVERGKSTTPFFLAPFSRTQLSNFRENVNKTTNMGKEKICGADPHGNRENHVTDPSGVTTSKEVNSDWRYSSLGRAGSLTPSERGDIPLCYAERPRSAGDLVGDSLVEREKISGFTETYGNLKIRNILPLRSKSFFIHQIYKNILICGLTSFNKINFTGPSSPSMQGDKICTADLVSMETKLFNLAIRGAPIISQQTEAKNTPQSGVLRRIEGLKILT